MSSSSGPANGPQVGQGTPVPPSTVTYAGSVQQTDESHAQQAAAQDPSLRGFFGDVFRPGAEAAAKAKADKAASEYATSQAQGLGHDITTKPGPHTGGHNYLAYQQDELHQMVNSNADPAGISQQGQTFNDVGNDFADMAATLDKATSAAAASWQGKAAQGGAAFTTGMSSWHGSTAQGAQYAGTQMFEQSQALDQARTNMPPPMTSPTISDIQHALLSFDPIDPSSINTLQNMANQANAAQANHQTMARVAQQYDSQLGTSATLPAFSTPSQFSPNPPASASGACSGAGGGGGSARQAPSLSSGGVGSAGSAGLRGHTSGSSSGNSGGYSAPPHMPTGQGSPGGQGATSTQGATGVYPPGSVAAQGGSPSPYPGGPASGSPGGDGGGISIGGMPIGGFGPTGGGDASDSGGGSAWGSAGSGGASSSGSGGGSGAGQAGPRSAAGAATAEESAVESGAAGARSSSEMSPGAMGAGRGKSGEDREHKRAGYLLEPDPESVFGADQTAIPRVIGE